MSKQPKRYISDIPELMAEWNWEKNNALGLDPSKLTYGSDKKAWWKCGKGHEWEAKISSRSRNGCPYCGNRLVLVGYNDLATTHPNLAEEWHPTKNGDLKPTDVTYGSGKKVWWKCNKGHEWFAAISDRTKGIGCPYCSNQQVLIGYNDLQTTHHYLVAEWHHVKNGKLKPTDVTHGSSKKVWWQCEMGHEWQAEIRDRTRPNKSHGCPYCSHHGMSYKELTVLYYLKKYASCEILHRSKIYGLEFDICIPSLKICIEYDGAHYHADRKNKDLHKNKIAYDNKITLYRIREVPLTTLNTTSYDFLYNPQKINELTTIITYLIKTLFDKNVIVDIEKDKKELLKFNKVIQAEQSLATTYPELTKEWHPTKNILSPYQVTAGSGKKVWWMCNQCDHEWSARISARTSQKQGCPICAINKRKYARKKTQ